MPRLLLVGVPLLVLAVAATAVAAAAMHHGQSSALPPARLQGTDVWPSGRRPAPAFALHDQNGRLVTSAGLRDHVWAITFLDSQCRQACPVVAHALAYVQHQLGPRYPLEVIVVSVLPQYDTPATVRAFARKEGLTGNWHWLLGAQSQLEPVWGEYGIWVQSGVEHTAAVYLVDRRGDVRVADGVPFIARQLEASVRALTPVARTRGSGGA